VTYRGFVSRSTELKPDVAPARRRLSGLLSGIRARARALPGGTAAWRVAVTLAGVAIVAVGIVLLPLPGPGWLIIFAGLGLLATEYAWASRLLTRARRFLSDWTRWAASRGPWARVGVGALGLLVLAGFVAGSWYLYELV
jgi:uncharacterized protein (TIGR02611 family)